jgi:PAS domain S-box-containing protein
MGLAEDAFDGRIETFSSLVVPSDVAGLFTAVENARQQSSPYVYEYRVVWPDGSLHWVAGRGRFYPDRTGEPVRMLGVITDISARKRFEEQLTATIAERDALLARLQLILDRTPVGVFISDPDFLISYWNPAAEQIFGWSAAEMLGRRPDELIMAAEVRARLPQIREQIAASQTTLFVESQNLRKDGQVIVCAWSNTPLRDSDGAFLGFLAMIQDVTERHRREASINELNAELEQRVAARTAELAAKNRELEVFAYSVSHDLKAPLRGIDGYSRLLQEDFAGRLDGDGPYYIDMIRAATASMGQLIDDLLAYSRVERRALQLTGLALHPLVEQVAAEYADLLAEAGAQLSIDLPELSVLAEEEGLAQSLRNLIANAVKFSRDVAAPQISIGGEAQGDTCLLWVRDNGIGFAMEYHDRIFDLFQRLHRDEDYPGTGIGLAIVRKAVERIGGAVWAESAPGAGATFYLRLPRDPSEGQ